MDCLCPPSLASARRKRPGALPRARVLLAAGLGLLAAGCGQEGPGPEPGAPPEALAAVARDPGVPQEALARIVDTLFSDPAVGETRALVVMHDGAIVAERYGPGFAADTPLIGWSMSKTVTGVLIGMLVAEGRLELDAPAPIERWQRAGDPRGEITLRHLLQMRSGLRHKENDEPRHESAEVRMLFLDGRDNAAGWAQVQPLEHEPGTTFAYSTPTSTILADIATDVIAPGADAAGRQRAMAEFLEARLAAPLGLTSLRGEYDAAGTLLGGSAIWANARDWARFGELLRQHGAVRGAQIVPRGWIAFMSGANPSAPDYGAQVWRNRPSGTTRDTLFARQGPADVFAAVGHQGQYLIIAPSQHLTILRLGHTDRADLPALVDQLARIVALYPAV